MAEETVKRAHGRVVVAWGEYASGPGWGNQPLWYIVCDSNHTTLTVECLQPEEQTAEMRLLFAASEVITRQLTAFVEGLPQRDAK